MSIRSSNAEYWKFQGIEKPIILASSSPRRVELLRAIGLPFISVPPQIDEGDYGEWDGGEILRQRAVHKAEEVRSRNEQSSILSADTVVVLRSQVFGKPASIGHAISMLTLLSHHKHEVWSSMCYLPMGGNEPRTVQVSTSIQFRALTAVEIEAYVVTGEPMDKAGAYGIQGLGGLFVQEIHGCYFNVVGLPISKLLDLIRD
jgi:septum formation protein